MSVRMEAKAKFVNCFRIDVDDGRAHTVALDLAEPDGRDMGPSALELCVMSLGGCYATIFALTASKMRYPVKNLQVKTEAVKSKETGTISEAALDILVKVDAPKDRVERLHELTIKDCPVGLLFEKAGVKIKYNLRTE